MPDERSPAIACSLDAEQVPGRIRDWKELLAHVTARSPIENGVRLELDSTTPVADLAELLEAEQACCRFFAFALTLDQRGTGLEVRAPAEARPIVESLFGAA